MNFPLLTSPVAADEILMLWERLYE